MSTSEIFERTHAPADPAETIIEEQSSILHPEPAAVRDFVRWLASNGVMQDKRLGLYGAEVLGRTWGASLGPNHFFPRGEELYIHSMRLASLPNGGGVIKINDLGGFYDSATGEARFHHGTPFPNERLGEGRRVTLCDEEFQSVVAAFRRKMLDTLRKSTAVYNQKNPMPRGTTFDVATWKENYPVTRRLAE
ncbi:hypothetical protein COV82_03725 [Candidatus Peregrinibacteria bacterium CG11_big_fil_rev_8_21_14_0_20_46_8]|nr:MAG: hypothetical protein COV82_03725 [Candidatus Peregrinibacteria bacterium CG11_big_fil_rev_8_21_14_0_20_46_8]